MHDTVAKTRKRILQEEPRENVAPEISIRLQNTGMTRALSDPISAHLELLYAGAFRWSRLILTGAALAPGDPADRIFGELLYASQHLHAVLTDLLPFLDRAEDSLSEREDITHRESRYEREVAPFSRLDSTQDARDFLGGRGFSSELAGEGAQATADLLKVVYLQSRLQDTTPKPGDLYAIVAELILDGRRHLSPLFEEGSEFMRALQKNSETS